MSYDYHVVKLTGEIAYFSELGPATIVSMGSWSAVREQVSAIIPGINWMDGWGLLQTEDGWMEFGVAEGQTLDHGFKVRTSLRSDHRWEEDRLRELCRAFDWFIIDGQAYTVIKASGVRQLPIRPD